MSKFACTASHPCLRSRARCVCSGLLLAELPNGNTTHSPNRVHAPTTCLSSLSPPPDVEGHAFDLRATHARARTLGPAVLLLYHAANISSSLSSSGDFVVLNESDSFTDKEPHVLCAMRASFAGAARRDGGISTSDKKQYRYPYSRLNGLQRAAKSPFGCR